MNLTRRDPFEFPLSTMNRLMNQVWSQENSLSDAVEESLLPLDISEDEKSLVVRASVPGFKPEEIDVQVHNGILTIKAEHTEESEQKTERYLRRERRFGSFSRSVALPSLVDEDSTEANLEQGVLTLRIAKSQAAMPRKVKIGGGSNAPDTKQ
jgi:HSP20 family protein